MTTIDPRVLQSLLKMQLSPNVNGQGDVSGLFDSVLSQFTAMNNNEGSNFTAANDTMSTISPQAIGAMLSSSSLPPASLQSYLDPFNSDDTSNVANSTSAKSQYDDVIRAMGSKYGVDPALIKGVIQAESSFREDAVSSVGAKGLMQLMDATASGLGVNNSFDPIQNIEGGTKYLSYLLKKYDGNEQVALAAYNAGPGRVDRHGIRTNADFDTNKSMLPDETQRYVDKVLHARSTFV